MMRILYLGNDKPHCTERFVKYALEIAGHEVTLVSVRGLTLNDAIFQIDDKRPDFVLFSKPVAPCFPQLLKTCKDRGLLTVCWQWDLYWGYRPARPPQFYSDLLFTTDGGHDELWQKFGYNHRVLRQGISALSYEMIPSKRQTYDVVFVGSVLRTHAGRQRLVKHLQTKYGNRFALITNTRGHELTSFLGRCKIVVGGSYPSPRYWSNRIYEMLGRACFLLYPFTEGLDEDFQEGVHYVGFERDNFQDLDDKIAYYLKAPVERDLIRTAGFQHCGERHMYVHRVARLLEHVASAGLALGSRSP